MQFVVVPESEVDDSFELVRTVQGVLRMPQKRPHKNKDGTLDYWMGTWHVPDYPKWSSIPGFPEFLFDPAGLTPELVRPLTAEERRAYLRGKVEEAAEARDLELSVLRESVSIRIKGKLVGLSPREFELLTRTIEESPLSHKRAVQFLEALKSKSGGAVDGFVTAPALHDHRKSILDKVERTAGKQARVVFGEAFRSRGESLVYDQEALPTRAQ